MSTELAKRGVYTALDDALADRLVQAIQEYPTYKTACAACGVSDKTVTSWLRRGTQAGATEAFADFARRFLEADAEHARLVFDEWKVLAASGNSGAAQKLKYIEYKWHLSREQALLDLLDGGGKMSDNLAKLIECPTPRLANLLRMKGWVRHPAWGTDSWGQVINTTGHELPSE